MPVGYGQMVTYTGGQQTIKVGEALQIWRGATLRRVLIAIAATASIPFVLTLYRALLFPHERLSALYTALLYLTLVVSGSDTGVQDDHPGPGILDFRDQIPSVNEAAGEQDPLPFSLALFFFEVGQETADFPCKRVLAFPGACQA